MINLSAKMYLILAILTEVGGTVAMKLSLGFIYIIPTVAIFILYALSAYFFSLSLKNSTISNAYAIWSAAGAAAIFVIGVIFFDEHSSVLKLFSLLAIIIGVIGLERKKI